jgi:hypothetical protein
MQVLDEDGGEGPALDDAIRRPCGAGTRKGNAMNALHPSSPRGSFFQRPQSRIGRLSVMLASAVAGFGLIFLMFAAGMSGGDSFFDNLWLAIPVMLAGASGLGAAATGLYALIARHERSMYAFVATLVGLFVIFIFIEEVLIGH